VPHPTPPQPQRSHYASHSTPTPVFLELNWYGRQSPRMDCQLWQNSRARREVLRTKKEHAIDESCINRHQETYRGEQDSKSVCQVFVGHLFTRYIPLLVLSVQRPVQDLEPKSLCFCHQQRRWITLIYCDHV
jgi:hypothetical protein